MKNEISCLEEAITLCIEKSIEACESCGATYCEFYLDNKWRKRFKGLPKVNNLTTEQLMSYAENFSF